MMAHIADILKEMKADILVQFLNECTVKVVDKKRTADTEITFATNTINCNEFYSDTDKTGIVLWVSKKEYNEVISKLNGKDK